MFSTHLMMEQQIIDPCMKLCTLYKLNSEYTNDGSYQKINK